jgi:hypothetical protein
MSSLFFRFPSALVSYKGRENFPLIFFFPYCGFSEQPDCTDCSKYPESISEPPRRLEFGVSQVEYTKL